ncbi:hypothetical protein Tco_0414347 [Tanacetum coccineum]
MAPGCSRAVALPKFGMHTYTSKLILEELKEVITEYCIPKDLHPLLPPSDLTMNKLPSKYIRIYVEQLKQGGLRIPFSTFFLAVIRHFGVHVSQLVPMGLTGLSYSRSVAGLKGLEEEIFSDRSEAMSWRHTDTDIRDDFLDHYNEVDAARLVEIPVPLRPPPRHLLYVCGLTTARRHPELSYRIKGPDGTVLSMDNFLQLPVWTGTVVSKGDLILDDQRPRP